MSCNNLNNFEKEEQYCRANTTNFMTYYKVAVIKIVWLLLSQETNRIKTTTESPEINSPLFMST